MGNLDPALMALTGAATLALVQIIKQAIDMGGWAALVSLAIAIGASMVLSATGYVGGELTLAQAAVAGAFAGFGASGVYSGVVKPAAEAVTE